MKKHLIFNLLSLIFTITTLSAAAQGKFETHPVKKFEANPINLAVVLVEHTDSAKIASILDYNGYLPQGTENGFTVTKDTKGHEIRYSFAEASTSGGSPMIVVKSTESAKSLDSRLKDMKFEKVHNGYERIMNPYSRFKTKCTPGSKGTLIFRRSPLPKP